MSLSRRHFLAMGAAGLGAVLGGCAGKMVTGPDDWQSPAVPWPRMNEPTQVTGPIRTVSAEPGHAAPEQVSAGSILSQVIPASKWKGLAPRHGGAVPMGKVSRMTVHHEGSIPVDFSDYQSTLSRLQQVQRVHMNHRGWADVGYHFIIDRSGRVWEGRPVTLQGAHVRYNNSHNIGVMVLGNFDQQSPSSAQISTLSTLLRALRVKYGVPVASIRSHQEWVPTRCPGAQLQPIFEKLRASGKV